MNLIEQDKRPIGGSLLKRVSEELTIPLDELTGDRDRHLIDDLNELTADPLLRGLGFDANAATDLVGKQPLWARAMVIIYRACMDRTQTVTALSDRLNQDPFLGEAVHAMLTNVTAIRSTSEILDQESDLEPDQLARFHSILATESGRLSDVAQSLTAFFDAANTKTESNTPVQEVEDFFTSHGNYFAQFEDASLKLLREITGGGKLLDADLVDYATGKLGIAIRREPVLPATANRRGKFSVYDSDSKTFILHSRAPPSARKFLLARLVAEIGLGEEIAHTVENTPVLTTGASRARASRALSAYAARAMLFPYDAFLDAAWKHRYDVAALCQQFSASDEQIFQRLAALRRPGAEGVPFAFMKSDPSGVTTKRFTLPHLPLPRFVSACPLWAIYSAFQMPGRMIRQFVEFPNKNQFIFVARSIGERSLGFHEPEFMHAIMIAYDVLYADDVVYSDGLDLSNAGQATPVGPNCRLCPREDCMFRQEDPIIQR